MCVFCSVKVFGLYMVGERRCFMSEREPRDYVCMRSEGLREDERSFLNVAEFAIEKGIRMSWHRCFQ
ncbi:hypothetical protein COLO4_15157 [Corchorus olitorius]|uniref:Uncharacterized protein n=1 Tax=Corchorus olitorius TaxID=93759 RepID=A0A1R3JP67_9ROSI|nr:hypothetical protein COLO4_15157 [Corchorus olitorius]